MSFIKSLLFIEKQDLHSLQAVIDHYRLVFLTSLSLLTILLEIVWLMVSTIFFRAKPNITDLIILLSFFMLFILLRVKRLSKNMLYEVFMGTALIEINLMVFQIPDAVTSGGIFYLLCYPILAVLLTGRKKGMLWSSLHIILMWIVSLGKYSPLQLSLTLLFQITFVEFSILILSQVYQTTNDEQEHLLVWREKELENALSQRNIEIEERKNAEKQLAENIVKLETQKKELEKMNHMMVDRELKMIELKKEIENLKSQLEKYQKEK